MTKSFDNPLGETLRVAIPDERTSPWTSQKSGKISDVAYAHVRYQLILASAEPLSRASTLSAAIRL